MFKMVWTQKLIISFHYGIEVACAQLFHFQLYCISILITSQLFCVMDFSRGGSGPLYKVGCPNIYLAQSGLKFSWGPKNFCSLIPPLDLPHGFLSAALLEVVFQTLSQLSPRNCRLFLTMFLMLTFIINKSIIMLN